MSIRAAVVLDMCPADGAGGGGLNRMGPYPLTGSTHSPGGEGGGGAGLEPVTQPATVPHTNAFLRISLIVFKWKAPSSSLVPAVGIAWVAVFPQPELWAQLWCTWSPWAGRDLKIRQLLTFKNNRSVFYVGR